MCVCVCFPPPSGAADPRRRGRHRPWGGGAGTTPHPHPTVAARGTPTPRVGAGGCRDQPHGSSRGQGVPRAVPAGITPLWPGPPPQGIPGLGSPAWAQLLAGGAQPEVPAVGQHSVGQSSPGHGSWGKRGQHNRDPRLGALGRHRGVPGAGVPFCPVPTSCSPYTQLGSACSWPGLGVQDEAPRRTSPASPACPTTPRRGQRPPGLSSCPICP